MKYAREYKKIAKRMAESAELEIAWKDLEEIYGTKATKQLKELTPADPRRKNKKRSRGASSVLHSQRLGV